MAKYKMSPLGEAAGYPWITRADTKYVTEGLYHFNLKLKADDPKTIAFKADIDAASQSGFDEKTKDLTPGVKKQHTVFVPYAAELDDDGNETGYLLFEFKQNATIKLKDGTLKEIKIGVRDAKDNDAGKVAIYGGSVVRAMYSPRAILIAASKQAGVRLDFAQVQIQSLKSGSKGFGAIEDAGDDAFVSSQHEAGSAAEDGPGSDY